MDNYYTKISKGVLTFGRQVKKILKPQSTRFLKDISGVVHVGANTGQERDVYNNYGLAVIWVEPIQDIFENLKNNIREYENQKAFKALITDVDDNKYDFHIANNNGASSSIYELKHHKDIWPHINYQKSVTMNSITLTSLFEKEKIDADQYQALIIDTQGSELLVLKGSIPLLHKFKYIKTEIADFESYDGCCQLDEMINFMKEHNFKEQYRNKFAQRTQGGSYYDILFKKIESN
jgi:FkbM family methyltransferase